MTGVLPTVHPHLLRWAADCGAGILPPLLQAVDGVATQQVRSILSSATLHSELARSDAPTIRRCADALAAAWSAPAPAGYLRVLSDAVSHLAADTIRVVQRVSSTLDTIEVAQRTLASEIFRANTAVDWSQSYVAWGTPEAEARSAAARTLAGAANISHQQWQAAITAISGALATDPGAALFAVTPPSAPATSPTPAAPTLPAGQRPPPTLLPIPLATPAATFQPRTLERPADVVDRRTREQLTADLDGATGWRQLFALHTLAALRAAEVGGDGRAQLLVYDPEALGGQGRVAISVGDVSSADHVAVLTPGIATSPTELAAAVPTAAALRGAAESAAPGERSAVVLWFGYDIPVSGTPAATSPFRQVSDLIAATSAESATEGAPLLVADTAAIRSMMRDSSTITLIGHSMGSVVTARAARQPIGADAVVLLGSPGVGQSDARVHDLRGVSPENVFVMSSDRDPVTRTVTDLGAGLARGLLSRLGTGSSFGTDPASSAYGAQRIGVPEPTIWDPGSSWRYTLGDHSLTRYLGGAGLLAVGAVVAGRTARVPRSRGR